MKHNYKIYQANIECPFKFRDKPEDMAVIDMGLYGYKEVYSGVLDSDEVDDNRLLEDIYYIFNVNHPSDFRGHSLSMSDIVELNGYFYYCASIGFELVEVENYD